MGCVQSYFRKAQSSGLSPSSTEESANKYTVTREDSALNEEERKQSVVTLSKEKQPGEEPESNDTSYGVEATAVRTLAASTGTVAILGTTAQTPVKEPEETLTECQVSIKVEEASEEQKSEEVDAEPTQPVPEPAVQQEGPAEKQSDVPSEVKQCLVKNDDEGKEKAVEASNEAPHSAHVEPQELTKPEQEVLSEENHASDVDNRKGKEGDDSSEIKSEELTLSAPSNTPQEAVTIAFSTPNESTEASTISPPLNGPQKTVAAATSEAVKELDIQKDDQPSSEELDISPDDVKESAELAQEVHLLNSGSDVSLNASKTADSLTKNNEDETNDISSERLKTNSLSDVSFTEEEVDKSGEGVTSSAPRDNKTDPGKSDSDHKLSDDNNTAKDSEAKLLLSDEKEDSAGTSSFTGNTEFSDDDKLNAAAEKIQSSFRGFRVRKSLKQKANEVLEVTDSSAENLIEVAKEELDQIIKQAEEKTESLINTPDSDEAIVPDEEFPAPPDDMLLDARKGDVSKEDESPLNALPAVPSSGFLSNTIDSKLLSEADDDSYRLTADEDLPAPDFDLLESSYTDDINTEIINSAKENDTDEPRDSTEGDITLDEEESEKLRELQKPAECDEKVDHSAPSEIQPPVEDSSIPKTESDGGESEKPKEALRSSIQSPVEKNSIEDKSEMTEKTKETEEVAEVTKEEKDQIDLKTIEEAAATAIQAGFRGFMTRKQIQEESETPKKTAGGEGDDSVENEMPKRTHSPSTNEKRLKGAEEQKEESTLTPIETEKQLKDTVNVNSNEEKKEISEKMEKPTEVVNSVGKTQNEDKDSGDPSLSLDLMNSSATVIQAGIRGFLVRQRQKHVTNTAPQGQANPQ